MNEHPLTTGEVAKYCHVTYASVLTWIEKGKIKSYVTPGGHHRVKADDFLSFLKVYNMPIPDKFKKNVNRINRKKILIVDDDKVLVDSLVRFFIMSKADCEIETAYNGFDAATKFLNSKPDLVLLDIRMQGSKGFDGYKIAEKIKETPEGKLTKIIAISGYFDIEGKKKLLALGVEACLDKPIDYDVLLKKVKSILDTEA